MKKKLITYIIITTVFLAAAPCFVRAADPGTDTINQQSTGTTSQTGGNNSGNDTTLFSDPNGAQRPDIELPNPLANFGLNTSIDNLFQIVVRQLTLFGGIIAFVMMLYGGYRYITSAGNPAAMDSAKRIIIGSIVGILIMSLAYVLVQFAISTANSLF